jgi:hypothetical protein
LRSTQESKKEAQNINDLGSGLQPVELAQSKVTLQGPNSMTANTLHGIQES